MSRERWYRKANAYAEAWKDIFGVPAPMSAVVLGLAVAEHETRCGDSWPGENNWGAVQLRSLNTAEHAAIAGIIPHPGTVSVARERLAQAGLGEPRGALHADSSPGKGFYFVYFAKFPNEAEGAAHCVKILAFNRPSCRIVMTDQLASEYRLAERMYATRYYEGFREPAATYEQQSGKWFKVDPASPATGTRILGAALNVEDYAGALRRITPDIKSSLRDWSVGDTAPTETFDLSTVLGQQKALNRLGATLQEDGIRGPKTISAIKAFQLRAAISADGIVGPKTLDAFRKALA